jgi:hypothetical protein
MKEYDQFLIWVKGLHFVGTGESGPNAYDLEGSPAPRLPDRGPIVAALLKLQQAQEGNAEATDKFSRHGPIGGLSTVTGPQTILARTPVLDVVKRFQTDFNKLPILLGPGESLWSYLLRRSARALRPEQLKQGFWFAVVVLEWWSRPLRESQPAAPQPVAPPPPPPPPRRGAGPLTTACEGFAAKRPANDEWTVRFDYSADGKLESVTPCVLGKEGKLPSDALTLTGTRDTWLSLVGGGKDGKSLDYLLLLDSRTVEVAQRNNNGLGPKRSTLRVLTRLTVRNEFDLETGDPAYVICLTEGTNLPPDAFDRLCSEQAAQGVVVYKTTHDVLVFRPSALLLTVARRLPLGPLSPEDFEASQKGLDALGPHRREIS